MREKFEGGVMGSDGCIYCIPLCFGASIARRRVDLGVPRTW